ncbi:MAG: alpha/beta fold hydrolase [Myxococcaceae bacterium]
MPEDLRITATDGYALGARLYGPESRGPLIVINGATGVPQRYYARFAEWAVHRGATVITWDYRGIGASRPHRLRGFDGTMRDWGQRDFEGVLQLAATRFPGRELVLVGHSIGGQILGQAASNARIARALTVGSQLGSWRLWPGYKKWAMAALWHVVMPGVTHALGRFPGQLGIGQDLPRNVALEWARWGRSDSFFLGQGVSRDGFERLRAPVLSFSLTDDDYAPRAAVDALHALFTHASVERRHVSPSELGTRAIGHFGFFRDQFAPTLWEAARPFLFSPTAPSPLEGERVGVRGNQPSAQGPLGG